MSRLSSLAALLQATTIPSTQSPTSITCSSAVSWRMTGWSFPAPTDLRGPAIRPGPRADPVKPHGYDGCPLLFADVAKAVVVGVGCRPS